MDKKVSELLDKISQLESEIENRESDVEAYRNEVITANKQLEQLVHKLNKDLSTLNQIHKHLVPTEMPSISGFEFSTKFIPSMIVGGDYLDIFEHEDKLRFGVIVSSAADFGVSALLLSAFLKLTGKMEARKGSSPEAILNIVIEEICREGDLERDEVLEKLNIFYSLIDKRSFELNYALLGDVVAIHQKHQSGELEFLEADTEGKTLKASLSPRDRVIVCSPGVLSVANLKGEIFGIERLYKSILKAPKKGVHEIRNQILFDVKTFLAGQNLARDITILVLEVNDRVIKLAK